MQNAIVTVSDVVEPGADFEADLAQPFHVSSRPNWNPASIRQPQRLIEIVTNAAKLGGGRHCSRIRNPHTMAKRSFPHETG